MAAASTRHIEVLLPSAASMAGAVFQPMVVGLSSMVVKAVER